MIPEDAVFWIASMDEAPAEDPNLLCVRHADAMIVPRGWTLDDRREDTLRLFRPADAEVDPDATPSSIRRPRRPAPDPDHTPIQLVIDGTGEIGRPDLGALDAGDVDDVDGDVDDDVDQAVATIEVESDEAATRTDEIAPSDGIPPSDEPSDTTEPAAPWQPDFDQDDDLDGLLSVTSPLLARAFRGTDRPG